MYVRKSGVFTLASAYQKVTATTWRRLDALVRVAGAWRGWFRKTGSLAAVVDYDWDDYGDAGSWSYLWQYRWITPAAFATPIRAPFVTLSARIENRDDYDSTYDIRIEGLVNGVWVTIGISETVVIPHNSWGVVTAGATGSPLEITQIRYGIGTKHFFDQVNAACTAWEEFGTYVG